MVHLDIKLFNFILTFVKEKNKIVYTTPSLLFSHLRHGLLSLHVDGAVLTDLSVVRTLGTLLRHPEMG